jgi:hypothetical protein
MSQTVGNFFRTACTDGLGRSPWRRRPSMCPSSMRDGRWEGSETKLKLRLSPFSLTAAETPWRSFPNAGAALEPEVPMTRNAIAWARCVPLCPLRWTPLRRRRTGRKASFRMACRTLAAVSAATRGWLLTTRDTVEVETPASWATRCIDMTL